MEKNEDLGEQMRLIAAVYKLGVTNISLILQFMFNQTSGQESEFDKLNLPLTSDELWALQMFYNFTFPNAPSVGANNNMEFHVNHISINIKKLVEGSDEELPYNPLYTYA